MILFHLYIYINLLILQYKSGRPQNPDGFKKINVL